MKKLLAVVAVCAALAGSVFATENFIDLGLVLPQKNLEIYTGESFKYSGIGGTLTGTSMYSELIGVQAGVSLSKETKVNYQGKTYKVSSDGVDMDAFLGLAIRPVNIKGFNLFVTPAIDYGFIMGDDQLLILLGVGCNVQGTYMLTDKIGISAGSDVGYYFKAFNPSASDSTGLKMFIVNPKLCLTIKY